MQVNPTEPTPAGLNSREIAVASRPAPLIDNQNDFVSRVMMLSADETAGTSVAQLFQSFGNDWEIHQSSDPSDALGAMSQSAFRCVVLVESAERSAELKWVPKFLTKSDSGGCPVVFVTDSTDADLALEARRAGVASVIPKHDLNASYLEHAITSAVGQWRLMGVIDLLNQQVEEKQQRRNTQLQRTERFAHEILTPLASVQEYISLVFDGISGPLNPEQASHLAYARGGCASIESSVEALVSAAGNQERNAVSPDAFNTDVTISKSLQTGKVSNG